MAGRMRIGVDVGGTFTDAVSVDEHGTISIAKTLTTPDDVSHGTLTAAGELGAIASVEAIVHGTTLVTNALLERSTAPVGLLTTEGFRDTLEIRRTRRAHLYDLHWQKPPALVRRRYRCEVRERIDRDGVVLVPLDEESVRTAADFLRSAGIRDVAICFLFSFRNDAHERRAAEIVHELVPGARVSLSSEVIPELREYERCSTTVLNAMAATAMEGYLQTIESELSQQAFDGSLHMIKADGGVGTTSYLLRRSIEAYNSGPAAGVAAAAELGRRLGIRNLITLDMGGTSTDVSLIWDGQPLRTMEEELAFGIPIRIPMVDVRSIGAGGGSIAWLDAAGAVRVGPQSAGAVPGPACYGLGGTEPTVTDANLILGRIDPGFFLGGSLHLERSAADAAVGKLADAFGWSLETTALAISSIAAASIAQAVREISIDRGYDPRDFTLLAYGGAGPLYAAEVAADLDIPQVVVPVQAGVLSALGCLCADMTHESLRTVLLGATPSAADSIRREWARLETDARSWLRAGDVRLERSLDMRYVGEAYELTVPLGLGPDDPNLVAAASDLFHAEHERLYGFRRNDPVEIVNARLRAKVATQSPTWSAPRNPRSPSFSPSAANGQYAFCFRSDLPPGEAVTGPLVVRDAETTTVVHAGQRVTLDELGNLRISVRVEAG
jgi:N-methylhydantoinase A